MNSSFQRCATYARYSSDNQKEASISDQQRIVGKFAEARGWEILPEHNYKDEALSGSGLDRPGFQALLTSAFRRPRPFDVLLVDDTSRISRNLADAVRISEQLRFNGIRLVAVSQGIDTANEQSDVMMTVHGLVDSLYIKELGKKTHRGLEGRALQGLHTGGACFGYDIVTEGESKRLKVNLAEAEIVVRIFEMSASGMSLKKISKNLNADGVPPPRGSKKKYAKAWVFTCIREMLHRELYIGQVIWNRRKFTKRPGTNKRISVLRPKQEWVIVEDPTLRIISQELWDEVQQRLTSVAEIYPGARPGLRLRSEATPYIFSGILKCGVCGGNLVIVAGRGNGSTGYYGCGQHHYRGLCSNALKQRRDDIEAALLAGVQSAVRHPEVVDYAVSSIMKALRPALEQISKLKAKEKDLRRELENLTDAIAKSGGSSALIRAVQQKEQELADVQKEMAVNTGSADAPRWSEERLRRRIEAELSNLSCPVQRRSRSRTCRGSPSYPGNQDDAGRKKMDGRYMSLKANGILAWIFPQKKKSPEPGSTATFGTLRGEDLNLRPLGYEAA